MKRHRIITQLETEQAQVLAALADEDLTKREVYDSHMEPEWVAGYWYGRYVGNRGALAFLNDKGEE